MSKKMLVIGLVREGKVPPDKRVPLTPDQCAHLQKVYPNLHIQVQSSPIRAFSDAEYRNAGIEVTDNLSACEVILGVKEVPVNQLIPNKTYLFFSHTHKFQEYNKPLLKAILEKQITLIDYELLKAGNGQRLIGFGRYAGVVGAYNAFRGWGIKTGTYTLKPAHLCSSRAEAELELQKVKLEKGFKLVVTGSGRVGHGAREIIDLLKLTQVDAETFLTKRIDEPHFVQLEVEEYFRHKEADKEFDRQHFYRNPQQYESNFFRFARVADLYLACHFWNPAGPWILSPDDYDRTDFRLRMIADVSCDIGKPIASTLRASTIAQPFYGYDRDTGRETVFDQPGSVGVMAVDNLPCELPRDASKDFGAELTEKILPLLINPETDHEKVIERATQTTATGQLAPAYTYLSDWLTR